MGSNDIQCCCGSVDISKIVNKYNCDVKNLLPILHEIQDEAGYISPDAIEQVAEELDVPVSQVHGTVTFYSLFYTKPHGKYVIKLCNSTPCHIEGSSKIRHRIEDLLNISDGETTEDGLFSLEVVSCMGLCGVSPAMMINDDVYGNLTPEMIPEIIKKYREEN
ncbi:MAG: NADH-quinone oxidoreductase subunit NuoE [Armatimonadota bacterium]